jgi:hypothetical protein
VERKEYLTNELISKKFLNQFDLVNYAILLTTQLIKTGRTPRVHADSDNPAVVIIEELEAGKDHLEDLIESPKKPVAIEVPVEEPVKSAPKQTERKKARRLFA